MTRPLVSVILPTYNCGKYLAQAIESVLSQSYTPLEIVAVDDGSTDDTLQVLARFGERVRVFRQPNRGPAAARNLAVSHARAEYLAFLDGDDLWLPGHLDQLMGHIEQQPDARIVYGDWLVWHPAPDGGFAPVAVPRATERQVDEAGSGWVYARLLFDSVIWIVSTVIHRSVYEAVGGFDESLRTGSDYDFWLRASHRFPVVKLRNPVAVYRQNSASVTNAVRHENNAYRIVERTLERYGRRDPAGHEVGRHAMARRLADLAWTHGYRHYWRGDAHVAEEWFGRAWRHAPLRLTMAAYFCAALARRWGLPRLRSRRLRNAQP